MKWTKIEEELLLNNLNLHCREIAKLLHRSYRSVLNKINHMGVKDKYLSLTEIQRNLIKEEANKKISITSKINKKSGGYRQGGGRGKKGYYKGFWCDSSYELAWVIYHIENGIKFKRNTEKFKYLYEDQEKYYIPDFIIGNIYFEIKGYKDDKVDFKLKYFPYNIHILYKKDMEYIFKYVVDKYGKNYISLYENVIYKKCLKCNQIIFNKKNKNGICKKCLNIGNKKEKSERKINFCSCGLIISKRQKSCKECYSYKRRVVKDRPDKNILINEVNLFGYKKTGKKYGVSDNTIRKWLK